jgi:hypothetical protein
MWFSSIPPSKGKCIEEFYAQYVITKKENWRILNNKEIYAGVKNLL